MMRFFSVVATPEQLAADARLAESQARWQALVAARPPHHHHHHPRSAEAARPAHH